jgi:hypothetical protein
MVLKNSLASDFITRATLGLAGPAGAGDRPQPPGSSTHATRARRVNGGRREAKAIRGRGLRAGYNFIAATIREGEFRVKPE